MASTASLLGTKRKRGASASAAEVVRCICSTSADDGQEMIECDGCKVWQHTDCVGARAGQLSWRCERCDPRPPAQLAAMVAQARARRGMDVGPADEYVPLADDDLRALQPQLPELSSWRPRLALEHAQAVPPPGYAAEPRRLSGGQMCFAASYGLFARVRRERGDLLARFVAVVARASDYLADPINMYPSLMLPKPYVHLLPAPTPLALDARRAGGEARFARCGCRPNAELVPAHVGPARQLVFVLVATCDIASGDEIVLPWEWDDMHPVHRLVRATPQTTNSANLRAHIASFLSAAEGFIPPCACTDPSSCLFVAMRRYAAAEHPLSPHPLPPLPKRGLAAVPRQGFGQGAVLLPPTSNSSTSSPDTSLWLPTPSTSPHTTFLSIASALHLHIQPDPAEQRLPHRMRKTHIRRLFDELKGAGAFERGRVWDPVGAVTVRKVGAAPNAGGAGAGSRSASAARSGSVASGRANGVIGGGGGGKKRGKMDVLSSERMAQRSFVIILHLNKGGRPEHWERQRAIWLHRHEWCAAWRRYDIYSHRQFISLLLQSHAAMVQIFYEPTGCNCDGTEYTRADITAAADKALLLASEGRTLGGDKYPHAYNDYEHFSFPHAQAPYIEFPVMQGKVYGGEAPGADRIVLSLYQITPA